MIEEALHRQMRWNEKYAELAAHGGKSMRENFSGRSLAVIDDLSRDERRYVFRKTRELKEALESGDKQKIDAFRIADRDFGVYEVFLEDSTRTKESFKNAAHFHHAKLSALSSDSSSFNKGESYADTFNNLAGYDNRIFIIRSKLEGVCRWLEESARAYAARNQLNWTPSFINAGDGKHEHPTQELLDEFTFLEDNNWSYDSIHVALVGDLFHGRTVHSKVDGLKVFDHVKVDLIAPDVLEMPAYYVDEMRRNGFEVRCFESIEAYVGQAGASSEGAAADKWYFTRPQLERMGDQVLQRQDELRGKITFQRRFLDQVPEGTLFYHPLPRHKAHPVIPLFLDDTPLNGWERQSANGRLVRIVLLGLYGGLLGEDFQGDRVIYAPDDEDFIEEVPVSPGEGPKHYSEGVHPISDGIVIDHICRGDSSQEIRRHMGKIIRILGLNGKGGEWISSSQNDADLYKGIIFRPGHRELNEVEMKRLAAIAPGSTLNFVRNGSVTGKFRLHAPPRVYNLEGLVCSNEACISHPGHQEGVTPNFIRTSDRRVRCLYCGNSYSFKEIWV